MTRTYVKARVVMQPFRDTTTQLFWLQDFSAEFKGVMPPYVEGRFGRGVRLFATVLELSEFMIDYPCAIESLEIMPLPG